MRGTVMGIWICINKLLICCDVEGSKLERLDDVNDDD